MKIRIFQINKARDHDRIKYRGTDWLFSHEGYQRIQTYLYDQVFEGEVPCKSLETIYTVFNTDNRPHTQAMHALSVSDVIAVDESDTVAPGYYYCDTFGFTKVDFQ